MGIRPKDQKLWIMVYSDTRMKKFKDYRRNYRIIDGKLPSSAVDDKKHDEKKHYLWAFDQKIKNDFVGLCAYG